MWYTEEAGGTVMWLERGAVGLAAGTTAVAVGAGTGAIPNYSFRIGLDPANHSFKYFGKVKHIQMDRWLKGVKGSDKNIFRIPMPWWE